MPNLRSRWINCNLLKDEFEKETTHPCQQILLELLNLTSIHNFDRSSATLQEMETFQKELKEGKYEKKLDEIEQLGTKYNCADLNSEWYTNEFKEKVKFLNEYGFLP